MPDSDEDNPHVPISLFFITIACLLVGSSDMSNFVVILSNLVVLLALQTAATRERTDPPSGLFR